MIETLKQEHKESLPVKKEDLLGELRSVLDYWINFTVDEKQGGFYGSVNHEDQPDPEAPLGIVMYSRILWAFSAAWQAFPEEAYLRMAQRAYEGILTHFVDKENGGVYWSVHPNGTVIEGKKQLYGQAFCSYALAEYYRITQDQQALDLAIQLYQLIEQYGFDPVHNGYIEAFSMEWKELGDLRLSAKDNNERKTMNTHLHVVEAYANLFTVWPDAGLKKKVENLLQLFETRFMDTQTGHLLLFFTDTWESRSRLISYGHDIEAAWLLPYCARQIGDTAWAEKFEALSLRITDAAARGRDGDGGLWYEYDPATQLLVREKHSWPQAESLLGYYYAWTISGNATYLKWFRQCWQFIQEHIHDPRTGEWYWGVLADYSVIKKDKAGFWKCPYHNTRALLELIKNPY